MIRLTDEEILDNPFDKAIGWKPDEVSPRDKWIAKAQLKKFVERGNEKCKEHPGEYGIQKRHYCGICWEALLEEIKE